jgi:hypothetical protein
MEDVEDTYPFPQLFSSSDGIIQTSSVAVLVGETELLAETDLGYVFDSADSVWVLSNAEWVVLGYETPEVLENAAGCVCALWHGRLVCSGFSGDAALDTTVSDQFWRSWELLVSQATRATVERDLRKFVLIGPPFGGDVGFPHSLPLELLGVRTAGPSLATYALSALEAGDMILLEVPTSGAVVGTRAFGTVLYVFCTDGVYALQDGAVSFLHPAAVSCWTSSGPVFGLSDLGLVQLSQGQVSMVHDMTELVAEGFSSLWYDRDEEELYILTPGATYVYSAGLSLLGTHVISGICEGRKSYEVEGAAGVRIVTEFFAPQESFASWFHDSRVVGENFHSAWRRMHCRNALGVVITPLVLDGGERMCVHNVCGRAAAVELRCVPQEDFFVSDITIGWRHGDHRNFRKIFG